jgi:hypothetical protein
VPLINRRESTKAAAAPKSSAEVNLAKNAAFGKSKPNITAKTIKAAITLAGEPSVVKRNGQDRPMCASYHLKGLCYSTCKRQYNHQPHSAVEDEPLFAWCGGRALPNSPLMPVPALPPTTPNRHADTLRVSVSTANNGYSTTSKPTVLPD